MLWIKKLLSILLLNVPYVEAVHNISKPIKMIYWQVKPYISFDKDANKMDGMLAVIFLKGIEYCSPKHNQNPVVDYVLDLGSRKNLDRIMHSDLSYGEGVLQNISIDDAVMWGPYDFDIRKIGPEHYLKRNLSSLNLMISDSLVVIIPRSRIAIANKVFHAVIHTSQIIVLVVILAFLFGVLVTFCEKSSNKQFEGFFGAMTAIYWSFVTMTTVGYGDVVPITFTGRFLSILWMFLGLIIASVLTATLTDMVNGTNGIRINNQKVACINNSHEEFYLRRDHNVEPILFSSYEEVVSAVRYGMVYASVLPYDIAAVMKDDIVGGDDYSEHLSMVYTLPGKIPFSLMTNQREEFIKLFECMFVKHRYDIVTVTKDIMDIEIELSNTFYGDVYTMFSHSVFIQIITGFTLFVIFLFIILACLEKKPSPSSREKKKIEIGDQLMKLSTLIKEYGEMTNASETNESKREETSF